MNTFIDQLVREYFREYRQQKEENCDFVDFESEEEPSPVGGHSNGLSGRILYSADHRLHKSPRLFVKFLSTEDQNLWPGSPIFWFRTEIHFYTRVAPLLDSFRSIRHLIPPFLHSKEDAGRVAIVFDHLGSQGFVNTNQEWGLDLAHLSLMARKIGEFHAYSIAAQKLAPGQLHERVALPVDSYTSLMTAQQSDTVQTLRQAMEPLRQDAQYANAVPRMETILANFAALVTRAFSSDSWNPDFVLCHRSYSQSNVMFRYSDDIPVDLVIVDWQTMAFASLGVDLGLVLYLEASQSVRDKHWDRLLNDYLESVGETFRGCGVSPPSTEKLLQELKVSAAATLNMLAYKVHQSQIKSNSDLSDSDSLISEALKDMVRRDII